MDALFDQWNEQKKNTNRLAPHRIIPGSIYWVCVGYNIGHEVYGKSKTFTRPVLVLKLLSNRLFLGVPLSSKTHERELPYHHLFRDSNNTEQIALLHQLRVFDSRRRQGKISKIDKQSLETIRERIRKEVI
ncbi:type II toxin-antitoxin system PemK/MazF family toxin [Helicobacter salomonis]|uniref:type II toxin-antitoxin system PemK/MazF family toxin n=1 Tax=Helicobacter salomonis TaxID=56878 RepID=UPI000CF1C2EE|nr:type II toxin-antitoxin system PemK/MazF family toxin [Helicobacter salomonis]